MSLLRYHKYRPTEIPIIIAPEPATLPAIFNFFEDCCTVSSAAGDGETLKLISVAGDFVISADLLDPKTEDVFLEDDGDGEFLGEGLGDFDLLEVEEDD